MTQLTLEFEAPPKTALQLRNRGIKKALTHAEQVKAMWGRLALEFMRTYCETHLYFMTEDLREASRGIVDAPPHLRAWGGIILSGARNGWIGQDGTDKVKNPKAHMANAAVWKSRIFRG
jgi:hypothetical protein